MTGIQSPYEQASDPAAIAPEGEQIATENTPIVTLPPELIPNIDHIVTEDDTPVDNFFSAKQQRLLIEPLYSSWGGPGAGRSFLADANVGIFAAVHQPPLVPDAFLSLDVQPPQDWWKKSGRSYFLWEFGKAPDVVIEIVSNRVGNETGSKMQGYARIAVPYYVIFDPSEQLRQGVLRAYQLDLPTRTYVEMPDLWMAGVGLGLTLWEGMFEGSSAHWLRWCDQQGRLIATGAERAEQERQRAEQEHQRAEQERQRVEQEHLRAEQERQRAERLAAQLRSLGIEPEE